MNLQSPYGSESKGRANGAALRDFWLGNSPPIESLIGKRQQMLWAETDTGSGMPVWVGVILTLSLPVTGAVSGVVVWLWSTRKEARKDAIQEWRDLTAGMQESIEKLRAEVDTQKTSHNKELETLKREYRQESDQMRKDYTEERKRITDRVDALIISMHQCEVEKTKLEGTVQIMQNDLRRLQVKAGDEPPPVVVPGIIIADMEGVIRVSSPAITSLLHWLPEDLIGENINKMIPVKFQEAHNKGLDNVRVTGKPPWTSRVIVSKALTKEGEEVPVSIALKGWQTKPSGDWLINAEITLLPNPRQPTRQTQH